MIACWLLGLCLADASLGQLYQSIQKGVALVFWKGFLCVDRAGPSIARFGSFHGLDSPVHFLFLALCVALYNLLP